MFWFTVLLWNPAWTPALHSSIESHLPRLEVAKDITSYCPNYDDLTHGGKVGMWSILAESIAAFESGFDPDAVSYEPGLGYNSIGLFQLSPEDKMPWCDEDHLMDPEVNTECAIGEFAVLISDDAYIAKGGQAAFHGGKAKGLARYWSTMWPTNKDPGGHREAIQKATKDYCTRVALGEL